MASANQTFSDSGGEFEIDTTQRTHTLQVPGRWKIRNVSAVVFWANFDAATVQTADGNNAGNVPVAASGGEVVIPDNCKTFTAKAGASSFGALIRREN